MKTSQQSEIENLKLEGKMLAAEVRRLEEILRKKREENAAQAEEIKKLQTYMNRILSFYGTGLSVLNWHDNGDSEPWDSFFDDNMDAEDIERLRKLEG